MGDEVEVEAGLVLELQAALHAIGSAAHHDERGHEADNLEILGELFPVPDLAVLRLQRRPVASGAVDLHQTLAAKAASSATRTCSITERWPTTWDRLDG